MYFYSNNYSVYKFIKGLTHETIMFKFIFAIKFKKVYYFVSQANMAK